MVEPASGPVVEPVTATRSAQRGCLIYFSGEQGRLSCALFVILLDVETLLTFDTYLALTRLCTESSAPCTSTECICW